MPERRPTYHERRFGPRAPRSPSKRRRDRFYSSAAWLRARQAQLARVPLCEDPFGLHADIGRPVAAQVVDHVIPRARRPDLELDFANFQSLCPSCHNRKTRAEQTAVPERGERES